MTAYISDMAGNVWRLPELLTWSFRHGMGGSADAFEISCFYRPSMAEPLRAACRFSAEQDGARVFTGVVDEYSASATEDGMTVSINGRSLMALLLDNEAEAAEYRGAGLDFILSRHVAPWGVTNIRRKDMSAAGRFTVASGASSWSVLRDFCRFCGGVTPRFDREGLLILDGSGGETVHIDGASGITAQRYQDSRYGVISQALVKNKAARSSAVVANDVFLARGGSCRRVVNVPRYTGADAMRYTGSWQIRESMRGAAVCELTVARPFAAFAGDVVALDWSPLGLTGEYRVLGSLTTAGPRGGETKLTLSEDKD